MARSNQQLDALVKRDRGLAKLRMITWGAFLGALGATVGFSILAANTNPGQKESVRSPISVRPAGSGGGGPYPGIGISTPLSLPQIGVSGRGVVSSGGS